MERRERALQLQREATKLVEAGITDPALWEALLRDLEATTPTRAQVGMEHALRRVEGATADPERVRKGAHDDRVSAAAEAWRQHPICGGDPALGLCQHPDTCAAAAFCLGPR